jgi:hypothetical protein
MPDDAESATLVTAAQRLRDDGPAGDDETAVHAPSSSSLRICAEDRLVAAQRPTISVRDAQLRRLVETPKNYQAKRREEQAGDAPEEAARQE